MFVKKQPKQKQSSSCAAETDQSAHHDFSVVEVPGVGGHAPADRVHDGVLHDVHRARHAGREEPLRPARQQIGLHQEAPGQEALVRSHLPVHDVLCENMSTETHTDTQLRQHDGFRCVYRCNF